MLTLGFTHFQILLNRSMSEIKDKIALSGKISVRIFSEILKKDTNAAPPKLAKHFTLNSFSALSLFLVCMMLKNIY